jgi:hypothetical protein
MSQPFCFLHLQHTSRQRYSNRIKHPKPAPCAASIFMTTAAMTGGNLDVSGCHGSLTVTFPFARAPGSVGSHTLPDLVRYPSETLQHSRIEAAAGPAADLVSCGIDSLFQTMWTVGNKHIERVRNGHDTGSQRYRFALEPAWVPS